jgi:hypothetical protein
MVTRVACVACVLAPVAIAGLFETELQGAPVTFPISAGGTGNTYEVIADPSADAIAARAAAADAGGYLVSITAPEEQAFVESLLINSGVPTGSYWMGLTQIPGGGDGAFAWANGEQFSYNNFADGEPNDFEGQEGVGQIYWTQDVADDINSRRGGWNDSPAAGYPESDIPDLVRAGFIVEVGSGTPGGNDPPPVAIPLPPAVLAAPLAALVAGYVARRQRRITATQ